VNKKLWRDWLDKAVVGEVCVYWTDFTLHECWFRHDVYKAAVSGLVFLTQKRVSEDGRFQYRATKVSERTGEMVRPVGWRP
jgi:hypothetical protein